MTPDGLGVDGRSVALNFNPTDSRLKYAEEDVSQTLTARMGTGGNQVPLVQETVPYCLHNSGPGPDVDEDVSGTLTASDSKNPRIVACLPGPGSRPATLQVRGGKEGGGKGALVQDDMSATLTVAQTQTLFPGDGTVRRLTPTECERLQGFKDGWTDVPYRGAEHAPDSPRYKALGNSMAVPVMRWIGRRIQHVEEGSHGMD